MTGPRAYSTEAELSAGEIQNLGESIGEIVSAGAGLNLRFVLKVEMSPPSEPAEEVVSNLDRLLQKVSPKLGLRR